MTMLCLFTATPGYAQDLPVATDTTVTVAQAQEMVAKATLGAVP